MSSLKSISITYIGDFPNFIIGDIIKIGVRAHYYDNTEVNITSDPELSIISLDDNFLIKTEKSTDGYFQAVAIREGSGIIKATYVSSDLKKYYSSKQFICHNTFFKTNYLDYLFSSFNKSKIESNLYVKIIFDTLMEMLDILYAYNEDLKIINNFSNGKSKFLSLLAKNIGFDRIDFLDINTSKEQSSDLVFKDLLTNMFDLLSIRGTKLAYELFFGALGYKISIQEFWYDENGFLIDINTEDPQNSTFYAYNTDGTFVDSPPVPRNDPRKNSGTSDSVLRNSKSNYIRVNIDNSISDDIADPPEFFSNEKKIIIKKYLEFLRPSHVQYITETTIGASFIDFPVEIVDSINFSKFLNYDSILNDTVTGFNEKFIIGNILDFLNEEWSTFIKWDGEIVWDSDSFFWDLRKFLEDYIEWSRI